MRGRTRIKVCCIADVGEALVAIAAGADVLGLVSAMPSGPGPIDEPAICSVVGVTPPGVASFLLTCLQDADQLIAQQSRCGATALQLVDALPTEHYAKLRRTLGPTKLVQVVHVRDATSIEQARLAAEHVDAILLDSGNPALPFKQLGGTGRVHDWNVSRRIVETVDVPVYLAGGLTATNVAEALATVRPFGVDVCGGVRTAGRLDVVKLHAFVAAVMNADAKGGV